MITPIAVDMQVTRPQPLRPEPQLGHHTKALGVLRSDCDLYPMQRHDLEAVVDRQRHGRRDDAASGQPLINPIANLTPGRRAANDAAHRQLASQLRPGAVRPFVVVHQPRQHPSLSSLTRDRADQPRVRRWPHWGAWWQRCLPGSQPSRVLAAYSLPGDAVPITQRCENHGALPQGDWPAVPIEATQPMESVARLLRARHLSDRRPLTDSPRA